MTFLDSCILALSIFRFSLPLLHFQAGTWQLVTATCSAPRDPFDPTHALFPWSTVAHEFGTLGNGTCTTAQHCPASCYLRLYTSSPRSSTNVGQVIKMLALSTMSIRILRFSGSFFQRGCTALTELMPGFSSHIQSSTLTAWRWKGTLSGVCLNTISMLPCWWEKQYLFKLALPTHKAVHTQANLNKKCGLPHLPDRS